MLKYYFNGSPNPNKSTLLLEELGIDYEPVPVEVRKGEQFGPDYLKINPNAKVPALDDDGVVVFDSHAILLYLGNKYGRFVPETGTPAHARMLSWLMFVASGLSPFSGQAVYFSRYAPEPMPHALERYRYEARRHYAVLDRHLDERAHMLGESYSIVDMAVWGWARRADFVVGDGTLAAFPALKRLVDHIEARPAARRTLDLPKRFAFHTEIDPEMMRHMFKYMDAAPT